MQKIREILKRVEKLELKMNRPVEGIIAGNYRSVFRGRGIEFSEVREYMPGDDIRSIDWNVTARFNHPYIKEFIEERDLNVCIVFDVSGSNEFGHSRSKKEAGFEIAASIMFAAMRNNDNVGLCLFTDHIERFVRPRKGRKFILRLMRELICYEPKSRKTDINTSLTFLSRIIRKKSIIFVISDFLSGDFEKPVKFLKNRHDVILINLLDLREQGMEDVGYVYMEDEETGEQLLVNTADKKFRETYAGYAAEKRGTVLRRMKRLGIDMVMIKTNEPFYLPLNRFFRSRESRMVR